MNVKVPFYPCYLINYKKEVFTPIEVREPKKEVDRTIYLGMEI